MLHQDIFDENDSDTKENDEAIARALQDEADHQDENEYLKPRKSYRQTKKHKQIDTKSTYLILPTYLYRFALPWECF